MNVQKDINRRVGWSIALSMLIILAGVLAIVIPPMAGAAVTLLVGWLLLLCGAAHLVFAWYAHKAGAVVWELLLGIVYIIAGGYLLMHPLAGMASLTVALVIYLFAEAILEFILSFHLRPLPGAGWLLFDGIVTLILAVMIWRAWPSSTEWALGILVGVSMLFGGVSRLMISLAARHLVSDVA
jgi:uncharacterized membrane protein HdeD (DUF308 family)